MANLRYVTTDEFTNQVPEQVQGLLTDDGTTLSPDSAILEDALLSAEQTVESYLVGRYDLPLQAEDGTVPRKIITTVFILAKHTLYGRRDAITQEIQVQYESAMGWLKDVANGNASLVILDSTDEVEDSGTASPISVSHKTDSKFNVIT